MLEKSDTYCELNIIEIVVLMWVFLISDFLIIVLLEFNSELHVSGTCVVSRARRLFVRGSYLERDSVVSIDLFKARRGFMNCGKM